MGYKTPSFGHNGVVTLSEIGRIQAGWNFRKGQVSALPPRTDMLSVGVHVR